MEKHKDKDKDERVVIHFDYDCFYASVFEAANPILKSLPLAIQQKQIIVTCNYVARKRGLHKLQLIRDAKRICPDVIIELGEDISRFRDASKVLYNFIKEYSWNGKVERLGFDEVWMDVTDIVDCNAELLNKHDLENSFFQTCRDDPTKGFSFDATAIAGHCYPPDAPYRTAKSEDANDVNLRLRLGSQLALYIRHQLEQEKGYTSTVGIATNKLLSKLVGNLNKPKGQTTLLSAPDAPPALVSNAISFMDTHEIGRVPGVGFKLAQKLREFILQRPAEFDAGLVYGGTKEVVTVADVRNHPLINTEKLEKLLAGPGSAHGIGFKVWGLLQGMDDTEVSQARPVPRQISIEDSYIRLDTMPEVLSQLQTLAQSLIKRMRIDLLGDEEDVGDDGYWLGEGVSNNTSSSAIDHKRWLAHPKTLRLTTRPRQPLQPDGTRVRSFKRISHSGPLPNFVFHMHDGVDVLADRLVRETLVTMFRKLHPEKAGWNLSLVNLAVTNMAQAAGQSKTANGRDIGNMFKRQDKVLRNFQVTERSPELPPLDDDIALTCPDEMDEIERSRHLDEDDEEGWVNEDGAITATEFCDACGSHLPAFAMVAHRRFHAPSAAA